MELTKQVPQKDLCKRMLELGWDKETNISWYKYLFVPPNEMNKPFLLENSYWDSEDSWGMKSRLSKLYPAPSVAELGEELPDKVFKGAKFYLRFWRFQSNWFLQYSYTGNLGDINLISEPIIAETEADARAKIWIYLKENNLI